MKLKSIKKFVAIILSILMITTTTPLTVLAATTAPNSSSNLKLHWLASNDYTADATGGGRTGKPQGNTINWSKYNGYYGATFNQSDMWYTVSNNLNSSGLTGSCENGGAGTTFAFMAYTTDTSTNNPFFSIFNNNNDSGRKTYMSFSPSGRVIYSNSGGSSDNYTYTAAKTPSVGWHTYAIEFVSSKTIKIYIDGVEKASRQSDYYDNHTFDIPNTIKIGSDRDNTTFFSGAMRDFRIYNTAIDAAALDANMRARAEEDNLVVPTTGDTVFANQVANASITANTTQPKIGSVGIENVGGRTFYNKILYSTSQFVTNSTAVKVNGNTTYAYIVMPETVVVLFDGTTDYPVIPIKLSFKSTGSESGNWSYSTYAAAFINGADAFGLNNNWIGNNTVNCNRISGWPESGNDYLGSTNVTSGNTCQVRSVQYEVGFKNGMQMKNIPSSNPKTNIPFYVNQNSSNSTWGPIYTGGKVYYVDVRNLNSTAKTAKVKALEVAAEADEYTTSSYTAYKNATLALINFNVNTYVNSTTNNVTECNSAISNVISNYNTALNNLVKHTHTYNDEWVVETAATCQSAGTKVKYCNATNCPEYEDSRQETSYTDINAHVYTTDWKMVPNQMPAKHYKACSLCTHVEYGDCNISTTITKNETCTEKGTDTHTCSICNGSYTTDRDALDHDYPTEGTHFESTTLKPAYTLYVCQRNAEHTKEVTDDGATVVSLEAYNDAVTAANVELAKTGEYTDETIQQLNDALANNAIDPTVGYTFSEIEAKITAIISATESLEPSIKEYTITVNVVINNHIAKTIHHTDVYGKTAEIDITDILDGASIQKWTITQAGATSVLSMAAPKYDMVITDNAIITVYATTENVNNTDYKRIRFIDRAVRTIGYGYLANGTELDTSAQTVLGVSAPELAFYEFVGWAKVTDSVYIAEYAAVATDIYDVYAGNETIKVNGQDSTTIDYDANIIISHTGTKPLGMKIGESIMPITDLTNVHAPYGTQRVDIVELDDDYDAVSMVTGKYVNDLGAGRQTVGFNCMFYLPEGCELVECGLYAKKGAAFDESTLSTATKVRSQTQSTNNEYTVGLTSNYAASSITKVYGMSYVTYVDENGVTQTAYSAVTVMEL